MKKIPWLFVICCCINNQFIAAQNSSHSTINFQSMLQGGLLIGKDKPGFQLQSINGVKWKKFSAGIGAGIDNYFVNSFPIFFDARADLSNKGNTPFLFIDAGSQLISKKYSKPYDYFDSYYHSKFYFNAGAGYKINLLKKNAFILSTSFSLKSISKTYNNSICDWAPCPENPPPPVSVNKYNLKRFSLQIGWLIW